MEWIETSDGWFDFCVCPNCHNKVKEPQEECPYCKIKFGKEPDGSSRYKRCLND